jgi:hypothetical protein
VVSGGEYKIHTVLYGSSRKSVTHVGTFKGVVAPIVGRVLHVGTFKGVVAPIVVGARYRRFGLLASLPAPPLPAAVS